MFTTFKKYMLGWYRQAFLRLIFAVSQSSLQGVLNILDPGDTDKNRGWLVISNATISDRPGQLIFNKVISYLIVEAHNSCIMGQLPLQYGTITSAVQFIIFQSPVLCNYVNCTSVTKSHKSHNSPKIFIDIQETVEKYK